MSLPDLAVRRLHSQQLLNPRFTNPAEIVAWLGALQGQDFAGAKWSLGLRLPGSADAAIQRAIADGAILRTWAMRGTLQLIAPQDLRWMLRLLRPHVLAGNARRNRQLALDEATLARSNAVLAAALQDEGPRTRNELRQMLEQSGVSTAGQRFAYMLQRASLDGLIVQGAPVRNVPVFAALDETIPAAGPFEREAALAELARRYFNSRGPASSRDFAWWSGLPAADARAAIRSVRSELREETFFGQTCWGPLAPPETRQPPHTVYLLPAYDEYLVGYADRRASLDPADAPKIARGNGFFSTIALDGRFVGTWRRTFKKGAVVIETSFFDPLDPAGQAAFAAAARQYAEYFGMDVVY